MKLKEIKGQRLKGKMVKFLVLTTFNRGMIYKLITVLLNIVRIRTK